MAPDIRTRTPAGRTPFGDRLRALRIAAGMNTPEMARALGVSKSSVTNWETGVSRPNHALVSRICALLSVTPDDLFGFGGTEGALPEEERRALRLFRRLSPLDRRNVESLMTAMLDNAREERRRALRGNWRPILRLHDKVCAGSGSELLGSGEGETIFIPASARGADAVITVTGRSMEPTFYDGDDLLVRFTGELRTGEIGIFVVDGQGTVKEYREDGLYPHNPDYAVIRPEDGTILCAGRVLGVLTEEMRPDREENALLEELLAAGAYTQAGG